jgi:hypothetical protein
MGGVLRAASCSRCTFGAVGAVRGRSSRCCNGALYRSRTHRSRLPGILARMQQLAVFSFGHARRVREIIMPCVRGIQFSAVFGNWRA